MTIDRKWVDPKKCPHGAYYPGACDDCEKPCVVHGSCENVGTARFPLRGLKLCEHHYATPVQVGELRRHNALLELKLKTAILVLTGLEPEMEKLIDGFTEPTTADRDRTPGLRSP